MIIPTKSTIRLKKGFTYSDYVIKRNEIDTSYFELCRKLKISLEQARAGYDKTFNLKLEDVGTISKPKPKPEYPYWNKAVAV